MLRFCNAIFATELKREGDRLRSIVNICDGLAMPLDLPYEGVWWCVLWFRGNAGDVAKFSVIFEKPDGRRERDDDEAPERQMLVTGSDILQQALVAFRVSFAALGAHKVIVMFGSTDPNDLGKKVAEITVGTNFETLPDRGRLH